MSVVLAIIFELVDFGMLCIMYRWYSVKYILLYVQVLVYTDTSSKDTRSGQPA